MRPYHLHGNAGFSVQQNRSESCGSRSHTVANLSRQGTCTGRAVCGRPAWHPCAFVCRRTGAIAAGYDATICRCSAVFVAGSWTCISLAGHCRQSTAGAGGCRRLRRSIVAGAGQACRCPVHPDGRVEKLSAGFLPVYSGVLAAGGEWNAGAAANGFLLTVLCFIAQAVTLWLQPLLRSYLAISMACGISSRKSLFEGCTLTGRLLRQAIGWAGKAFAALMSIQRVVTVQLDRSASRLGQLLTGSVPIVGQALSNAQMQCWPGCSCSKAPLALPHCSALEQNLRPCISGC